MSNVKVAVRVRPFNSREKGMNAELCIDMNGAQTIIYDLTKKIDNERKFTFDYSFWSFDSFKTSPTSGMLIQETPGNKYAGQNEVFKVLGKEVLDNAWEGYHCCLFAYGQTGAGKSYSMMGYPPDVGIVPMACQELFTRVGANTNPNKRYEVYVSMLEVYNECVYDLLVNKVNKDGKGLDIRESTSEGIFVQGLTKVAVNNFASIEAQIERGTANRSVGATLMNATSSRAHTVTQIRFEQVTTREGGKEGRKVSVINLVDLAGSEKNDQTGATGDRLKEATNINKSLSTLGNVISALADLSEGKAKAGAIVVPYRNSKLTRLLQNALGGSSKTIMICAVSPASVNYEESLSTLRYADRAKQIKNAAIINEDPTEKRLRELTEENEKLKKLLADGGVITTGSNPEAEAELAALEEEMRLMSMSFEERLKEAEQKAREEAAAQALLHAVSNTASSLEAWAKIPHLYGLNADPQLNGRLRYELDVTAERRKSMVGRPPRIILENPTDDDEIDIPSGALGVLPKHCSVRMKEDFTAPYLKLEDPQAVVYLNGQRVTDPVDLKSGDVMVISETCAMTLKVYIPPTNPNVASLTEAMREDSDAYHIAIDAITAASAEAEQARFERRAQFRARMAAAEAAAAAAEMEAKKKEEELNRKIKELEAAGGSTVDMKVLEEARRQAAEETEMRLREKLAMEEEARIDVARQQAEARIDALQRDTGLACAEANAMARDLHLPYACRAVRVTPPGFDPTAPDAIKDAVRVVMKFEGVDISEWTPEQLDGRLFLMRDIHSKLDGKSSSEKASYVAKRLSPEADPWWDPVDPDRRLGSAWIDLEPLANGFRPVVGQFPVVCEGGGAGGEDEVVCKIEMRIEMAKANGKADSTDAVDADKYSKFLPALRERGHLGIAGAPMAFRVALKKLTNVSTEYTGLNVRYEWAMSGVETLVNMDRKMGTRDTQGCVTLNHVKKFESSDLSKRTAYWIIGEQDFKTKKFLGGKLRLDVYGEFVSASRAEVRREAMYTGPKTGLTGGKCCVIM